MVKPPVCDVWSGRLQESNHVGGGGEPLSEKRSGHTFSWKKIYCMQFLSYDMSSSFPQKLSSS